MFNINRVFDPTWGCQSVSTFHNNSNNGLEPTVSLTGDANQNIDAFFSKRSYFASADTASQERINGNDLVLRGSVSNDCLIGSSSNDLLYGLAGNDYLNGKAGADKLNGGTGNDWLVGGKGNDILIDGDGGDYLTGGKGADQFWLTSWSLPATPSIITDFEVGTDTIKVGRLGARFDNLSIQDSDKGATLCDQGHVLAILRGVNAFELTASSFIFANPELADKLQATLDVQQKSGITGVTSAIITPDGFSWQGASGVSDLVTQTPTQPDDIFGVGSVSKSFAAVTALKLQEQGTLSLEDTLGKWLPDVAKNIPDGESITVRQLLNGKSGIFDFDNDKQFKMDLLNNPSKIFSLQPEDVIATAYGKERQAWEYPNTGFVIAGLIMEKATGKPYADVLREQVLDPLGLKHTFGATEEISSKLARSYLDVNTDGSLDDVTDYDRALARALVADNTVFSSAPDLARFSQSLLGGELLSSDSLKQMLTFVDTGFPNTYGLGFQSFETEYSELGKVKFIGHGGDAIGYSSSMWYYPDFNVTLTYLENQQPRIDIAPTLLGTAQ